MVFLNKTDQNSVRHAKDTWTYTNMPMFRQCQGQYNRAQQQNINFVLEQRYLINQYKNYRTHTEDINLGV